MLAGKPTLSVPRIRLVLAQGSKPHSDIRVRGCASNQKVVTLTQCASGVSRWTNKSEGAKKPGKVKRGLLKAEKKIKKAIKKTGEFGERALKKTKELGNKGVEKSESKGEKAVNKVKQLGKKGFKKTKEFGKKTKDAIVEFFE